MSTLEERIEEMRHAISIMETEHTSDIKQLYERVNALQQQVTEQRKRLTDHEQSTERKFDSLVTLLMQQFKNIDTHFVRVDQQFEKLNQQAAKTEQWMNAMQEGLNETKLYSTRTYGIVEFQQADIRVLKEDVGDIKERLSRMETKTDEHTVILNQHTGLLTEILSRLPEKP